MYRIIIFTALSAVTLVCAKKAVPEASLKGVARFQLSGGAAISQPNSDDYNPQVVKMPDGYLALVFGSDRTCAGCTGHNLFVARSTAPYNNDAVFPAFAAPAAFTVAGTPLNRVSAISFAGATTGSNLRIYLNNAAGVIQFGDVSPAGPYNVVTASAIVNTTWQNATITGIDASGTTLFVRTGGALYAVNPASNTPTLTAMTTGGSAVSLTNINSLFSDRTDGYFSLSSGAIGSMSPYGTGGNLDIVNTAIAKAKINARNLSLLQTSTRAGDLMFISGTEPGSSTQDMYVVDGLNVASMWNLIQPKPPMAGGQSGGSGGGSSAPNLTWSYGTLPASTTWKSIAFGNGKFVALSSSTTAAATSFDGKIWTSRTLPSTGWVSVTYGNGLFVAIASSVGTSAMTSPDGITWTTRTLATNFWTSVTFANNTFVAVTQGGTTAATSPDGITWTTNTNLPASGNWMSVTYGNGIFVAVRSGSNQAATSPDGITWTARTLPTSINWSAVAFGNDTFVAVAQGGTVSASSTDGVTWTSRTINSSNWNSVTFGNGYFVAVGSGGGPTYAVSSPDGITWTNMSLGVAVSWAAVTYGNGFFVAVNNGTLNAASTAVAVSNPAYSPVVGLFNSAQNVTISSSTAGALICYTTDGVTQPDCDSTPACIAGAAYSTPLNIAATTTLKAAACKSGMAVATTSGTYNIDTTPPVISGVAPATSANIGNTQVSYTFSESAASGNIIWTQTGGTTDPGSPHTQALSGAELNSGTHTNITLINDPVLVSGAVYTVTFNATDLAGNSATAVLSTVVTYTSGPPGSNWTARTLPASAFWNSLAYGNSTFVALGGNGTSAATSVNGTSWILRTLSSANWQSVAFGNGLFVAIAGGTATAISSPDGISWTNRTLPGSPFWISVAYGNSTFVAISQSSNTAATSPDGITWTLRTMLNSGVWTAITYGNGLFVAVASSTTIAATSPDGITWTSRTMPSGAFWSGVAFGNNTFVALGGNGTSAATSPDGITWTARTLPSGVWIGGTYGNGVFTIVSSGSNTALTSPDGVTWTSQTLPASANWKSILYANGLFVTIASGSTNAASAP